MTPEGRIFLTGTMRTGGSLLITLLSVHSKLLILNERVHFFRFVHKRYEPLTAKNIERMLQHQRLRLKYRKGIQFEVDSILADIQRTVIDYPAIYDALMDYFLQKAGKPIWGEYAALQWREIPYFLRFFPQGKVVHIFRDPRAVLSSWKKLSTIPNNAYLNALFNWIDSVNYMDRFSELLPPERYFPVRYESIMEDPEGWIRRLCDFIGVPFEERLLRSDEWSKHIGNELVTIPRSAHEGANIVGFSTARTQNWMKHLEEWEICLAEWLAGDRLDRHGYSRFKEEYPVATFNRGLDALRTNPLLLKHLAQFLGTGEGTNQYPTDPTDPRSWGAPHNPSEWFVDSPVAKDYFAERAAAEEALNRKYGA